jgi:hypothetical protein
VLEELEPTRGRRVEQQQQQHERRVPAQREMFDITDIWQGTIDFAKLQ